MPTKSLNALATPLVISFTFRFMFTLVDLVFVRAIKDEAPEGVAAIGVFIPIQTLFIAIWVGLSAGFTASISQAFGKGDENRVRALKRAMIWLHLALVPVLLGFAAIIYLATPLLNLKPDLERDFLTYSLILVCAMPFSGFLSIYPDSIVKAHHDTISTMKAGIFSTLANVSLNALFIFVFDWGIAGIALATVFSRYAGLGYAAFRTHILERARLAGVDGEVWDRGPSTWSRQPMREILALGLPGCLAFALVFGEEWTLTVLLTREADSEVYLAAVAVYNRLASLAIMPAVATAVAVLPFVARLAAENRVSEVRRDLWRSTVMSTGLVLAIAIPVGWLFPGALAEFFVGDRAAKAGANMTIYLALIPAVVVLALPYVLMRPVFEALGMPRIGVRVSVIKSLGFCVPLLVAGYFTAKTLDGDPLLGIIIGVMVGQLLASLVTVWFCRKLLATSGETDSEPAPARNTESV